ncbi:alpha/beta fold hydrolase [Symbiobacterium thermophilum]|uniref:alpha/beta fold hydrolase n=1 Tax=Symbiobacterium thermophilum TaxID=2734 RepID=UPI0002F48624|nr:alpha/beta fold hydrolase [Symbiobacterium thermophilum]
MTNTRQLFSTDRLRLEVGETISATVGYETYGRLNARRDNAVLLCHPLAADCHAAAGPADPRPGWWEPLIGPGRAFDTDRYFVIAADTFCGWGTGEAIPQITVRDNVRLQRQLLKSLGIERLACVAGPSTGGFQALEWAVTYPDRVDQVIAVASGHQASPLFALAVCQAAIDAIRTDPAEGLLYALRLYLTLSSSNDWLDAVWGRRTAPASPHPWTGPEGRYAFQAEVEAEAERLAAHLDPGRFAAAARMALLHNIAHGNRDLDVAAQKIAAEILLIPVSSDILFPPSAGREFADLVRTYGGRAEVWVLESLAGHRAALLEAHRLAEPISAFLGHPVWH